MATQTQEELNPVAPVVTESVAPTLNLMPSVNPSAVYSSQNIQQTYTNSPKSLKNMKIGSLEKKIAKANSIAEMNQVEIMNAPKAMGVLTGEASHQSQLDTAKLNALTGIYNTKLADLKRKEDERQQFIQTYGADPKQRPDGMSKREFAKAIQGGKFQDLITEDFKQKQLQTLSAQKSLSGGGGGTLGERLGSVQAQAETNILASRGEDGFVNPYKFIEERNKYIQAGGSKEEFDSTYETIINPRDYKTIAFSGGSSSVDQWANLLASGQASVANVPTNIRNEVISRVSELGTGVNKQLSDTAITAISQTEDALYSLQNLKTSIQGNEQFLGPVSGWQKINPWSKSREVQADVDRVRQVVGKALEGGVLRKEDEEKYKKILATLLDTPATAYYKIEALENDLRTKIENYKRNQAQAGRYVQGATGVNQEDLRTKYNY